MASKFTSSPNLSRIPIPPKKKSVNADLTAKSGKEENAVTIGIGPSGIKTLPRKSKVGEYIREMKRNDDASKETLARGKRHDLHLSLEDLYLGKESADDELSPETVKRELRKNQRIVKEKDMVILKLREACQDLSVKYADAENTIDQIRFHGSRTLLRKSQSELQVCSTPAQKETKDQATETTTDVLSEPCSSWIEKVKNWKTDSTFNASADADSGFRGSDLAEQEVPSGRQKATNPMRATAAQIASTSKHRIPIAVTSNHEKPSTSVWSTPRRSRSQTNLHWPSALTNQRARVPMTHFESLDKLLDEATAHARRVQRKSEILSHLLQSPRGDAEA